MAAALRSTVDTTPGISGGLLALEPGHPDDPGFARYFGSDGRQRDFVADGYDYRGQAWYRRTMDEGEGWWSEPYLNRTAGSRSEEHTSELQSLMRISYAVFCLKKQKIHTLKNTYPNRPRLNSHKS